MDNINESVQASTDTSKVETQTEQTAKPVETSTAQATSPQTGTEIGNAAEVAPYNPNFKFRVLDKEHEVDEWLKPIIKDAETEKKIKDLYEKAYGLEPVKQSREKFQKEAETYKGHYSALYNDVAEAMQLKNSGNLDAFFEKLQIPTEKVADWMLKKLEIQQLPPEQKRVYDELNAKEKAEAQLARQLEAAEAQNRQLATQAREWEVDQWLAKPEVNSIVSRYDSENGAGAFKSLVAQMGVSHFHAYGEDAPTEQMVSQVMKMLGGAYKSQPAQMQQASDGEKKLPVIPNISGKNVSPTQKIPKSVDDLRRLQREMLQDA